MKKYYLLLIVLALLVPISAVFSQGTTTAGLNGQIFDDSGVPLPGATVVAVEESTGSQYGTITDDAGYFRLPHINPGGPYTFTVTYVGYNPYEKKDVYLTLGQTLKIDATLSESALELEDVVIVANQNDIIDGNRTGAETNVSQKAINQIPTLERSIEDYIKLTPQATFREGGISIAGANNRYNAISIDGAVNNDVFGLAATGTNGGQTGGTAFSADIIDQYQIQIAPYDVRQSGFNGASINAVTKRGKNHFEGTAYSFWQNQNLAGKTPYEMVKNLEDPDGARRKLSNFLDLTSGLSVGGPIIKDKLHFFFNGELQGRRTPQTYLFENYQGDYTQEQVDGFADFLRNEYGYDPGGYTDNTEELYSQKFFVRFDWNIHKNHKLKLRHSYTNLENTSPNSSSNTRLNFFNNGVFFPSLTNSTALELKSTWDNIANNLIIGFTAVRDDRDPIGANFPALIIEDIGGSLSAGSEPFSTANKLDQDILTVTNNLNFYQGAHTITVGVNFEYYNTYNLFMRKNFGEYVYNSLDDFYSGASAFQYDRNYSLVDDVVGDGSDAAAKFKVMQWGLYGQDEWWVRENFKLTFGLRIDIPIFVTDPREAPGFNSETVSLIESKVDPVDGSNYDMQGAQSGKMPDPQFMLSPRVGFNWDVKGDKMTQLRGGVGIFTSRMPLVWAGGSYTNNGVTVGGVFYRSSFGDVPITFRPQWDEQYTYNDFYEGNEPSPSGQMDVFAQDFKFPQVLRTSLAVDQQLPWGLIGTLELMYSKNLNNVVYYNYNVDPSQTVQLQGGPDNRWINVGAEPIDDRYSRIMLGANTNKGYSYTLTAQLQKSFNNGIQGSVAYTFGEAKSINDGLSSQNSSQWRYVPNVNGRNHLDLAYSNFDLGSRVIAFLGYKKEYANNFATGISLFFEGRSGKRFSYLIDNSRNMNFEDGGDYSLIWIPENASEINLIPYTVGEGADAVTVSAEEQWNNLNSFIESDNYLKNNRGGYAERNGARLPFESYLDMKIVQDFYINVGNNTRHTLQFSLDIFNVLNLINKEWGVHRFVQFDGYELYRFEGFEQEGSYVPTYTYRGGDDREAVWNVSDPSSRWRMQFGVRYIFGTP